MKKISALFLLSIYLIAATATAELLKLPLLVAHYYQHKAENINTGLNSFLKMHYEAGNNTSNDAKENSRLPFKSVHHSTIVSFISSTPPLFITFAAKCAIKKNLLFEIPNHLQLPSKYFAIIFQPPRNCQRFFLAII